ncbi:MAG: substrate-binding domain-containing protein [Rhodospirillales bacterium]|nr:substrate-binding domain-containing protein [Rhodospirillales bacterium]
MRRLQFLVFLAVLAPSPPTIAADMVLSGSTTVQSRILDPLAKDIKTTVGIEIKVEGVGSGNGIKRLAGGEVEAAIISSHLEGILKAAGLPNDGTFKLHEIAEDAIVPVVNAKNPVSELSWEQLTGLYSGTIRNWKEVGGPDLKVVVVTSHPASATREVVWDLVMGKKVDYARDARIVYATKKEMVLTAEHEGAIGAVSQGFFDSYVTEAQSLGDPIEIRMVKSPKISRPLALVTKGDPSPEIAKLLSFLRSDAARAKFR